jgi:hypothetical protein
VAAQNLRGDPEVITMVMVISMIGLIVLFAAAGELGKRSLQQNPAPAEVDKAKPITEES